MSIGSANCLLSNAPSASLPPCAIKTNCTHLKLGVIESRILKTVRVMGCRLASISSRGNSSAHFFRCRAFLGLRIKSPVEKILNIIYGVFNWGLHHHQLPISGHWPKPLLICGLLCLEPCRSKTNKIFGERWWYFLYCYCWRIYWW